MGSVTASLERLDAALSGLEAAVARLPDADRKNPDDNATINRINSALRAEIATAIEELDSIISARGG